MILNVLLLAKALYLVSKDDNCSGGGQTDE